MRRLRPVLIVALIVADLVIFFGTPFLSTIGSVPSTLRHSFTHFDTDPAGAALPVIRLLIGCVLLAAIVDQFRPLVQRAGPGPDPGPDPTETSALPPPAPAQLIVRDRWHDLPDWTWVSAEAFADVPTGPENGPPPPVDTAGQQIERFSVTVGTSIDFDEALQRFEVHDAVHQLAAEPDVSEHRRAVIATLSTGRHWPFRGSSSFDLSTMRFTATRGDVFDGLFALRSKATEPAGPDDPQAGLAYLATPTGAATALVESDPDLVVALIDHLCSPSPERPSERDLYDRLVAATTAPGPPHGTHPSALAPEAVFRVQRAGRGQLGRANTRGKQFIVSVARIDRGLLPGQPPAMVSDGSPFEQVPTDIVIIDPPPANGTAPAPREPTE